MDEKVTVLEERLRAFLSAGYELLHAWQDLENGEDYGSERYPFAGSFDEVLWETGTWVEEFITEVKGVQS